MMELELDLRKAVESLKNATNVLSVASGCELFSRFVSRTTGDLAVNIQKNLIVTELWWMQKSIDRKRRTIYRAVFY